MSINDFLELDIPEHDILFVSNFSSTLAKVLNKIQKNLEKSKTTFLLTYRKGVYSDISYEMFLEKYFDELKQINIFDFQKYFKGVNFQLPVVAERFLVDYNNLGGTLGNRKFSYEEITFFIMSYTLYLAPYIKNSKIIFGGYSDNFISTLTYYLAEFYSKKSITFHELPVVDYTSQYLVDSLYGELNMEYVTSEKERNNFLEEYSLKENLKILEGDRENVGKPIWDVVSYNIFNWNHIKFALVGYKAKSKKIERYLNIDRPSLVEKFKANLLRLKNKILVKSYFKKVTFQFDAKYKYVYYPLQLQPEASTNVRSPYHANQLSVAENISKSLPLGYKLLVKEHPKGIGMKPLSFYRYLNSLPNIELVPNNQSGRDILKQADLLVSSGGTTNLEAISANKKAILLDRLFYMDSDLISYSPNIKELFPAIEEFTQQENNSSGSEELSKLQDKYSQRRLPIFKDPELYIAKALMEILRKVESK